MNQEVRHVDVRDGGIVAVDWSYAQPTESTLVSYWRCVASTCRQQGLCRILVTGDRTMCNLGTMPAYEFGQVIARLGILGLKVAVVAADSHDGDQKFLENVLFNRSVRLQFFHRQDDAIRWLSAVSGS